MLVYIYIYMHFIFMYIYIYIYCICIFTHILHTYMHIYILGIYPQCMLRDIRSHRPKDQLLLAPEVDVSGPAVYAMKPGVRTVGGTVDYAVLVAGVPAVPWRTW